MLKEINKPNEEFMIDGFYFISPGSIFNQSEDFSGSADLSVESMHFIGESLLLVVTSTLDVRVLYTQKFHHGEF